MSAHCGCARTLAGGRQTLPLSHAASGLPTFHDPCPTAPSLGSERAQQQRAQQQRAQLVVAVAEHVLLVTLLGPHLFSQRTPLPRRVPPREDHLMLRQTPPRVEPMLILTSISNSSQHCRYVRRVPVRVIPWRQKQHVRNVLCRPSSLQQIALCVAGRPGRQRRHSTQAGFAHSVRCSCHWGSRSHLW